VQTEELRKQHQSELQAQIAAREEERRLAQTARRQEGAAARAAAAAEVARLEAIKARKLAELRDAGVPAKYCAELAKYKVGRSGH
jgi:Trichohyalin-plectin-homology domain